VCSTRLEQSSGGHDGLRRGVTPCCACPGAQHGTAPDPKLTAFLAEVAHGRIRPDEAARQLNSLVASAQPTGDFAATDLTRCHAPRFGAVQNRMGVPSESQSAACGAETVRPVPLMITSSTCSPHT
jgi:hypothetical protein